MNKLKILWSNLLSSLWFLLFADAGLRLKERLKAKLIEHKQSIDKNGQNMPEIRNWGWALHLDVERISRKVAA